jgi:hypothetical protein
VNSESRPRGRLPPDRLSSAPPVRPVRPVTCPADRALPAAASRPAVPVALSLGSLGFPSRPDTQSLSSQPPATPSLFWGPGDASPRFPQLGGLPAGRPAAGREADNHSHQEGDRATPAGAIRLRHRATGTDLHMRRRVSDGTRTRDRLDHKQGVGPGGSAAQSRLGSGIAPIGAARAIVNIPLDPGRFPLDSAPIPVLGASARSRASASEDAAASLRTDPALGARDHDGAPSIPRRVSGGPLRAMRRARGRSAPGGRSGSRRPQRCSP